MSARASRTRRAISRVASCWLTEVAEHDVGGLQITVANAPAVGISDCLARRLLQAFEDSSPPLLLLAFNDRRHPAGLAGEVFGPFLALGVEADFYRVSFQFVNAQHGRTFVLPFRDDRIDLRRLLRGIELMRSCLDHFVIPAHRPLVASEGDCLLGQFFLRPGLALYLLGDELPGPL